MFSNTAESITFWKVVGQRVQGDLWVELGAYATEVKININSLCTPPHATVECYLPELNKTLQLNVTEEAVQDIDKLESAFSNIVETIRPHMRALTRTATYH